MATAGKMLILAGGILVLAGLVLLFADRIPFIGELPGDIVIRKEHFRLYVPLTTSILLSALATLILWAVSHWRGK